MLRPFPTALGGGALWDVLPKISGSFFSEHGVSSHSPTLCVLGGRLVISPDQQTLSSSDAWHSTAMCELGAVQPAWVAAWWEAKLPPDPDGRVG